MSVPNGQTAIARLVLVKSWTVTIEKQFGLKSVVHFKKKQLFYFN